MGRSIENAVNKAISNMPNNFVLKDFLEAHREEVKEMIIAEYEEAEMMELFKEYGKREERRNFIRLLEVLDKNDRITEIGSLIETPESLEGLYKEYGIE